MLAADIDRLVGWDEMDMSAAGDDRDTGPLAVLEPTSVTRLTAEQIPGALP